MGKFARSVVRMVVLGMVAAAALMLTYGVVSMIGDFVRWAFK